LLRTHALIVGTNLTHEYSLAMRYWWVNQNQTFRHEVDGGYLWSPKLGPEVFGALATLIGNEANAIRGLTLTVPVEDCQIVAQDGALGTPSREPNRGNASISSTDHEVVFLVRRGQGLFRQRVSRVENGLLLTPSIDHQFDRGSSPSKTVSSWCLCPFVRPPTFPRPGGRYTPAVGDARSAIGEITGVPLQLSVSQLRR
jgi:hypothetical protein